MQRLSGEFLSRLCEVLRQCSAQQPADTGALGERLRAAALATDPWATFQPPLAPPLPQVLGVPRVRDLQDDVLAHLSILLPWRGVCPGGDGGALGAPWCSTSARPPGEDADTGIAVLACHSSLAGRRVLDLSCTDGHASVEMACCGAKVWAVACDAAAVAKTLVHAWVQGVEREVVVVLADPAAGSLQFLLLQSGAPQVFDLVHARCPLPGDEAAAASMLPAAGALAGKLLHIGVDADHGQAGVPWPGPEDVLVRMRRALGAFGYPEVELLRCAGAGDAGGAQVLARRLPARTERTAALARAETAVAASAGPVSRPARFRKVLVVGLGRSGTSALASFLRRLGFHLGDDADPVLHESAHRRRLLLGGEHDALRDDLQNAAAAHGHVAWKDPKLHAAGVSFIDALPQDWLVMAIFRDAVAVAERRQISDGVPFAHSLAHCMEHQAVLNRFVASTNKQVLPVSYERLMSDPQAVLEQLAALIDPEGLPAFDLAAAWAGMQQDRSVYRATQARGAPTHTGGIA